MHLSSEDDATTLQHGMFYQFPVPNSPQYMYHLRTLKARETHIGQPQTMQAPSRVLHMEIGHAIFAGSCGATKMGDR